MGTQCNIDARGRAVRLVTGLIVLAAGVLLTLLWAMPTGGWWRWLVGLGTAAAGGFQIYEGWAGWCIMRAMGFKTPV